MFIAVAVSRWERRVRRPSGYFATVMAFYALFAPIAAFAQQTSSLVLDGIPDTRVRESIRTAIDAAKVKGVPEEPLLAKVREGIAKQSKPELIHGAVNTLAGRLERAQRALAPTFGLDELTAGAGALAASVPDDMLRSLRAAWPAKPLTVPLGVLTELVANGIPAKSAAGRVHALMERGASSAQLVALGDTVRADVAAGRAADASMELRTKAILSLLNSAGVGVGTTTSEQLQSTRGTPPRRPPSP